MINRLSTELNEAESVHLAFKNISYSISVQQQQQQLNKRCILNNLNGYCPPGQLTAILGSSGAGKTSLLNILAQRIGKNQNIELTGQTLANNSIYTIQKFSSFAAYVMQNDILFSTMTVLESLQFVSNLKYSDPSVRTERVKDAIKLLKLEKCKDTIIGNEMIKGVSGGERKRTSIGVELVNDPYCILLDEPTSGLDSFTAFTIINLLKQLAKFKNRTIIFTIHQPSSDIFMLIDRIMLLAYGKFVYQGPRNDMIHYFSEIGYKCPINSNPLDYMIDLLSSNKQQCINLFYEQYERQIEPQIYDYIEQVKNTYLKENYSQNTLMFQTKQIYDRAMLNVKRDKILFRARTYQIFMNGLLVGLAYLGTGRQSSSFEKSQNIFGATFISVLINFIGPFHPVMIQFPAERQVFLKEENSGLYSTIAYFMGKSSAEIPFIIIFPIILQLIIYWMIGFNDSTPDIVFINIFISVLIALSGNSIGLFASSLFKSSKLAAGMLPMVLSPLILFSGFFANQKQLMSWIGWIVYLNPIKYGFEALIQNQYTGHVFGEDDINDINPVDYFDVTFDMWISIWILITLIVIYRILALVMLYQLRDKLQ